MKRSGQFVNGLCYEESVKWTEGSRYLLFVSMLLVILFISGCRSSASQRSSVSTNQTSLYGRLVKQELQELEVSSGDSLVGHFLQTLHLSSQPDTSDGSSCPLCSESLPYSSLVLLEPEETEQ